MNTLLNKLVYFLFLTSCMVLHAEKEAPQLIFPSFASQAPQDSDLRPHRLPESGSLDAFSTDKLRSVIATASLRDQMQVAAELIRRGDQQTILQVVYAFKQGNIAAEEILENSGSLNVIPYLMEDVAHGSLEYYGTYIDHDAVYGAGRIRVAAVRIASSILANSHEFKEQTKECLKKINSTGESDVWILSEESRYLIQWWLLNEDAFKAQKWDDVRPLPFEISYFYGEEFVSLSIEEGWDREKQPLFGQPAWRLSESFDAWAERIVDPKRRNLRFVALSWDGKKVVEHPPTILDPKVKTQEREPRKNLGSSGSSDTEPRHYESIPSLWIWLLAAVIVVPVIIVFWNRRNSAG